jgi:hypothetical protein
MRTSMANNERRNRARDEMREIRTPQTRMSFLSDERYNDQPGGMLPESLSDPAPGLHAGKGPRSYRRSDDSIQDEVCRKITDDPAIDASEIEVVVSEAEVILQGRIDSRDNKRRLEDLVESVRGVRHVENRVRIHAPDDLSTHAKETFK